MNIYDIAEQAGVSIATVSRVVNGSDKVSARTRERVLAVMEKNHYTPNAFARGLGLDSMKLAGIMCPDISDSYMARAVAYLEEQLHSRGYECILGCSGTSQRNKEEYTQLLLSKRIDTLLMVGSCYAGSGQDEAETDYIRNAAKTTPVFLINGCVPGSNIYCARADDFQAVCEVTAEMIQRGRKRILFLYNSDSFSAGLKRAGYEAALKEAGYPVLGELKLRAKNEIEYTRDLLLQYKNLEFDAVVAADDGMAVGALKYAKIRGIRVPEELMVTGYNDSLLAVSCEPELTSVDSRLKTLCRLTTDHMIALLEKGEEIPHEITVPCSLVKRCTTDF